MIIKRILIFITLLIASIIFIGCGEKSQPAFQDDQGKINQEIKISR